MKTHAQQVTPEQYQQLLRRESAQRHRASTPAHFIYFLPRRNTWMTARAGRGGAIVIRFFGRCPCEDP